MNILYFKVWKYQISNIKLLFYIQQDLFETGQYRTKLAPTVNLNLLFAIFDSTNSVEDGFMYIWFIKSLFMR